MLQSRIKRSLFTAALGVAAVLGVAGSAQAAIYAGHWDPAYGNIFPDLGWEATATFDVPSACLGQADGSYAIAGSCSGFQVLTAQVDFYNNTVDSNPLTSPVVESFNLSPGVNVTGLDIAGGALSGVETGFFQFFVPGEASSSIAGGGSYSFSLILLGSAAQLVAVAHPLTQSPGCIFVNPSEDCTKSDNVANGTFTLVAVPEPETYALMLAGLAAVGYMSRRRRTSTG
jgi:hypothetical protein